MPQLDIVDRYCALLAANAPDDALLELIGSMTDDEKMRAISRLAYEREVDLALRLRDGWFAFGGRRLHS